MCDHFHEATSRYDRDARLLTLLLVCPVCRIENVVETLEYEPRFVARAQSSPTEGASMIRSRSTIFLAPAAVAALAALAVVVGGSGASASTAPSTHTNAHPATVGVAKSTTVDVRTTSLGKILVNSHGRTLYLFKKDSGRKSACTGACAKFWPPLRASGKPTAGRGASASKLGTIKRSDGKPQVTYKGHPLYTFQKDTKAGQTNGEGLSAFGASWFVVSPTGNQISGHPSPPSSPAPSPGGGGY